MERAYVGLGANLGDRERTLQQALVLVGATPGIELVAVSSSRETDPVGYLEQPRFVNAVAALDTSLHPHVLLATLLDVERAFGRTRDGARFGPRTIDLDLLLYGNVQLDEPGLTLPHPRLHERRFALEPLYELDPALVIPGRGAVAALLAELQ